MIEIPGYTIEKELGRGGMASVYLATQEMTKRKVAIKVMSPQLASDPTFTQRFLKEATCAQLEHNNIITVYDAGTVGEQSYIVMELASGGDLSDKIKDGLTIYECIKIIKQIASALGYAHERNYVHRDVKPDNVLFRADGSAVLTDFGIAKATSGGTKMTAVGMAIGSPHYMSPEQARGKELDGRSDIYSLGIAFYEMLMGNKPYDAEDTYAIGFMHVNEEIPRLEGKDRIYLQPILEKMLAKDPADRYPNAEALIEALDNVQPSPGPERDAKVTELMQANATQMMDPGEMPGGKKKGMGMGAIAAVAAFLAVGAYAFMNYDTMMPSTPPETVATKPAEKPVEKNQPVVDTREQKRTEMAARINELIAGARQKSDKADYKGALAMVDDGLKLDAANAQLLQLRDDINTALSDRKKTIDGHLAKAKDYMGAKALISPRGKNAYSEYQKVLKIDDRNKQAKRGVGNVIEQLAKGIEADISNNRFKQAEGKLETALAAVPWSKRLKGLRTRIASARDQHELDMQRRQVMEDQRKMMEEIRKLQSQFAQGGNQAASSGQNQAMLDEIRKLQAQLAQKDRQSGESETQKLMMEEIRKLQQQIAERDRKQKEIEAQAKMQAEIEQLKKQLAEKNAESAKKAVSSSGKPVLKMTDRRKVSLAARFTGGFNMSANKQRKKTQQLINNMRLALENYLPSDTELNEITNETVTFELADGDSIETNKEICSNTESDYVFGNIMEDPHGSSLRDVEVFLFNCTTGSKENVIVSTEKFERIGQINRGMHDFLRKYMSKHKLAQN